MQSFLNFSIETQSYNANGNIKSDCNAITFINYGANAVTIENNIVLQQGQSFAIEGNQGEITNKVFQINFAGSAAGNNLAVIRKVYVINF
jgi:hypothetical protein